MDWPIAALQARGPAEAAALTRIGQAAGFSMLPALPNVAGARP
ncbi:MAG TPA: hypothetical protein VMV26_16515 [Alphaproteobacteria bacterium]|nr:hypothetical protein [Alphaproteobacteria bacterium]